MGDYYYGVTDTGKLRSNNEDAFIAEEIMQGRYVTACVIDGVGGYEGGEIAAELTRETIREVFSFPFVDVEKTLRAAVTFSNQRIFEAKDQHPEKNRMACVLTLTVADIKDNRFYYAHIGDTRLYLFRDNSLIKITRDHSFVGFLEDSGKLSEEAAMRHPKRNEINKALGFDAQFHLKEDVMETGNSPFLPGDLLLLCSDGLTDMVNNENIVSILSTDLSISEKAHSLIDAANAAGGKDNITVVLIKNNKHKTQHAVTSRVKVDADHLQDTRSRYATTPLSVKSEEASSYSQEENKTHHTRKGKYVLWGGLFIVVLIVIFFVLTDNTDHDDREHHKIDTTGITSTPLNTSVSNYNDTGNIRQDTTSISDSIRPNSIHK